MLRGSRAIALTLAAQAVWIGLWVAPVWAGKKDKTPPPGQAKLVPTHRGQAGAGPPPPPPPVVFRREPDVILIPSTRVYYVPELKYDLFRYGKHWYINNGGNWYRARGYGGPYTYLEFDHVPPTILRLPDKYHRQPVGPGVRSKASD